MHFTHLWCLNLLMPFILGVNKDSSISPLTYLLPTPTYTHSRNYGMVKKYSNHQKTSPNYLKLEGQISVFGCVSKLSYKFSASFYVCSFPEQVVSMEEMYITSYPHCRKTLLSIWLPFIRISPTFCEVLDVAQELYFCTSMTRKISVLAGTLLSSPTYCMKWFSLCYTD